MEMKAAQWSQSTQEGAARRSEWAHWGGWVFIPRARYFEGFFPLWSLFIKLLILFVSFSTTFMYTDTCCSLLFLDKHSIKHSAKLRNHMGFWIAFGKPAGHVRTPKLTNHLLLITLSRWHCSLSMLRATFFWLHQTMASNSTASVLRALHVHVG